MGVICKLNLEWCINTFIYMCVSHPPHFVTPGSFHPHHPSSEPTEARRKRSHTYQACQTKTCCSSTTTASSHRGQTSERPSLPWNRNWYNPASQCKVDGTDHWRHSYFIYSFIYFGFLCFFFVVINMD
jgi:hypothetical protein